MTTFSGDVVIPGSMVFRHKGGNFGARFRDRDAASTCFAPAGDYGYEMETLTPIDAEIYEVPPGVGG